jgi:hypothetical protein
MSRDERGKTDAGDDMAGVFALQAQTKQNDEISQMCQQQVNDVFALVDTLQNTGTVDDSSDENSVPNLGEVSSTSIKLLATQLNKLNIMNLKIAMNSIQLSKKSTEKKIYSLRRQCDSMDKKIALRQATIDHHRKELEARHNELIQANSHNLNLLTSYNIVNINNQVNSFQLSDFKLLKEIVFSRDRYHNLLVYHQPILRIGEFLNYDIIDINQFLESLIKFQIQLADLFKISLPYLKDLTNCLPNSSFYDLIKQKEDMMFKKDVQDDPEKNVIEKTSDDETPVDKIVRSGNGYKIPLSTKTQNWQRRISMVQSPEPDLPYVREDSISTGENQGSKTSSRTNLGDTRKGQIPSETNGEEKTVEDNVAASVNKKMILIPHKILNKPFNKLTIKEFLNFLIVVVKIVVNFEVFLVLVINEDEGETDIDETFDFVCDFVKVLEKVNRFEYNGKRCQNLLDLRLKLKDLTENVYKLIIHGEYNSTKSPTILQDLNFSELIENQTKKSNVGDWDMVSKMF